MFCVITLFRTTLRGGKHFLNLCDFVFCVQVKARLAAVRAKLDLDEVIGCAPIEFPVAAPLSAKNSLWGLYMHQVLPEALYEKSEVSDHVHVRVYTCSEEEGRVGRGSENGVCICSGFMCVNKEGSKIGQA